MRLVQAGSATSASASRRSRTGTRARPTPSPTRPGCSPRSGRAPTSRSASCSWSPRVPAAARPAGRRGLRRPAAAGDHAASSACARCAAGRSCRARRCRRPVLERLEPFADDAEGVPRGGPGRDGGAVRPAAGRRGARAALLHAEPLDGDGRAGAPASGWLRGSAPVSARPSERRGRTGGLRVRAGHSTTTAAGEGDEDRRSTIVQLTTDGASGSARRSMALMSPTSPGVERPARRARLGVAVGLDTRPGEAHLELEVGLVDRDRGEVGLPGHQQPVARAAQGELGALAARAGRRGRERGRAGRTSAGRSAAASPV